MAQESKARKAGERRLQQLQYGQSENNDLEGENFVGSRLIGEGGSSKFGELGKPGDAGKAILKLFIQNWWLA